MNAAVPQPASNGLPAGASPPQEPLAVPIPDITDADIAALLEEEPVSTPNVSRQPVSTQEEDEEAVASEPPASGISAQQLAAMLPQLIAAARQPTTAPTAEKTAIDVLKEQFPDADADGLSKTAAILDNLVSRAVAPLQQQVQQLASSHMQQANQMTLREFTTTVGKVLAEGNIPPEDHQMVINDISVRGVQHQNQGRGTFDLSLAEKMAADYVKKHRLRTAKGQAQLVGEKKERVANSAPISHGQESVSAIEQLNKGLLDPKNTDYDYNGPGFTKALKAMVGYHAKKVLG